LCARLGAIALLVGLAGIALIGPAAIRAQDWAPPQTVFVESTGHLVDGLFLEVWSADPALLGDPITEEFTQRGLDITGRGTPVPEDVAEYAVQYFENVALAYVPENADGEQVVFLPIGRDAAAAIDRRYRSAFRPAEGCGDLSGEVCANFPVQDHTLRHGFLSFWREHDGLRTLGSPISEEFVAADGYTLQYFERGALRWRESELVSLAPLGREQATRLKLKTTPVEQPESVPLYDPSLFVAPAPSLPSIGSDGYGPGPIQGGYKEIVVSISAQSMWAYEGGQLVISSLVSTGTAETPAVTTPIGYWSVLTKYDVQTMEGTISGEYYRVEDVPYVMYFDNLGNALHGTYWHNNFGTPMSHGCVNLPMDVAAFLYGWTPIGTPVTVIA
jgi:hypothetical protein